MQQKLITSQAGWYTFIIVGLLILVGIVMASIASFEILLSPQSWSLEAINERLTLPVPKEVSDLSIGGRLGRGGFLELSFTAPPSEADHFISQFCDDKVFQGYDPFKGIDVVEPLSYAVPIKLDIYRYYSYSLNTPATIWGNRCLSHLTQDQVQIMIDRSNQQQYIVGLELYFTCELCRNPTANTTPQ